VERLLSDEKPDAIVHFAAESHVDRSILSPEPVFETNLRGTFTLLEAARKLGVGRFLHVSTDEVYGSLESPAEADETYPLNASSPYSAAKAGSDLLARSYFVTSSCPSRLREVNNHGPSVSEADPAHDSNALERKPLPVYGDGRQVRTGFTWTITAAASGGARRAGRESAISGTTARRRISKWSGRCWRHAATKA
jgi:dTDP-glucose 4,6-dehydratase